MTILKTQIVRKLKRYMWQLKNLNVTKPKFWENLKTQVVTKLKNLKYDKTKKKLKLWQSSKIQITTKPKNSNSNKFNQNGEEKNAKIQIVTKLILWQNSQLKNSNCNKTLTIYIWNKLKSKNCDKTKKSNSYHSTSKWKI